MNNNNKRQYINGCFCADWVDVDVKDIQDPKNNYVHKDLQTLLQELEEIKKNLELLAEKEAFLENLMQIHMENFAKNQTM